MAMEKEELLKRIEKKQKDIEKINKRIAKWSKGLRPQDIEIIKPFGDADCIWGTSKYTKAREIYDNYKDNPDIPESDDYNKGPDFYEAWCAYLDLGEANATLQKYQTAIDKIDNFAKEEKIEVIWNFLTEWENKAFNWYLVNAEHYFELKKNYKKEWENQKSKYIERYGQRYEYRAERVFEEDYYYGIDNLTQNITSFTRNYENGTYVYTDYSVDKEKLSKILKQEKERKYKDLINRVTKVTGIITDASRLEISPKGNLDGIVVGEKGKAKVETIEAGGYNIQCFHYRCLVHQVK